MKMKKRRRDPTGNTEKGWMWKIHCPECNQRFVMAMPDSGMKALREFIGSVEQKARYARQGSCGDCGAKLRTEFGLADDGELVCAMTPDTDDRGITILSRPELDPTPGFTEKFSFSAN